jgi:tartrate-resistant acid phosphatase type 5
MLLNATPDSLTLQFFTQKEVLIDSYVLHQPLSRVPKLYPVSPNPFLETTLVSFSLPSPMPVQLRVFNSLGQEVASLYEGLATAGSHRLAWARGTLPTGLYYVQLQSSEGSLVTRAAIE